LGNSGKGKKKFLNISCSLVIVVCRQHYTFDQFFCVLDGNFLFHVDDEILSLQNGDTLFIPRNVKHCFTYDGKTSGTLLVNIFPGKGMENYFLEMGKLVKGQGVPDMAALQALYKTYDSEILGPSMKG
jgi:hypothetical protein